LKKVDVTTTTLKQQPTTTTTTTVDNSYGPLPKLPLSILQQMNHQKSRLAMVVLGHVDAGKSTLMGQVLYQLGHVPKRTLQKYQKQATELGKPSFALAWIMDEDTLERERGITMELATKFISTNRHEIIILDAPGHADFVPCMITGAASADVGILVVAATRGEFEAGFVPHTNTTTSSSSSSIGGGQTREHVVLARGLGVSQLIVAVNKLDAVHWDQERFLELQTRLLPFLTSNGFSLNRIRFIPLSGLTGENVKTRSNQLLMEWYSGPTLLEAMDSFVPAQRNIGTYI
jgi:elongation factor 1 alpha-like protein